MTTSDVAGLSDNVAVPPRMSAPRLLS